ncbi:hypothetical protein CMMCA002_13620 [Clavibacter michiganensis subsp. michiganensis]|nr:hypothetical protein CMMCA002_13620 [Clavibacter michiganensis subsp. michiganensis]
MRPKTLNTATSTTGHRMVGFDRAYLRPSASWPRRRGAGGMRIRSRVFRLQSVRTTTTHASALIANDQPAPTASSRIPLSAGPTMPPSWNTDELTLIAFRRCCCPTISVTNTWRAGLSITVTSPVANAMAKMCHASTAPESVSTASSALRTA